MATLIRYSLLVLMGISTNQQRMAFFAGYLRLAMIIWEIPVCHGSICGLLIIGRGWNAEIIRDPCYQMIPDILPQKIVGESISIMVA